MIIITDFDIWGDGKGWGAGVCDGSEGGDFGMGFGRGEGSGGGYVVKGLNESDYFSFHLGNGIGSRFGWGEGDGDGAANSHDKINKTNLNKISYQKR